MADYVADALRLRLAKDRALAQVAKLFGGPPPEDVLVAVRQRAGLPPSRRFVIGGRFFDVTAIVDFATARSAYAEAAIEENTVLVVPGAALARAAALIPPGHELGVDVLPGLPCTVVDDLDAAQARAVGALLRQWGQPDCDVATAHVVLCAQQRRWPVVTNDPGSLLALDSSLGGD